MTMPATAPTILWIVFRGLLTGGLALGLAWISLAVAAFLRQHLVDLPTRRVREFLQSLRDREREIQVREQQLKAETFRLEREAQDRTQTLQQQGSKAEAKRRRVAARAQAILAYSVYTAKIHSERFTREMLDEYLALLDDASAEEVDGRLRALVDTLDEHVQEVEGPERQPLTLEQLQEWRQTEIQRIEASTTDERLRNRLMAAVNVRFSELATRLIEDVQP